MQHVHERSFDHSLSPRSQQGTDNAEEGACFNGLPQGVGRYDLLMLIKKTGKVAGFKSRMVELLDYYMAYTRDSDWEEGAYGPVIYQSIARTALDLGLSERQVQRLETQLHEIGALQWNYSGNCKRYGRRCEKTGRLLYAYGVDLSPLAGLHQKLCGLHQSKKKHDENWMKLKRQISFYRRACKDMLEAVPEIVTEEQYTKLTNMHERIAYSRIRAGLALERLQELHDLHKSLYEILNIALEQDTPPIRREVQPDTVKNQSSLPVKMTRRDVKNVVQKESTTQKKTDKSDSQNRFEERGSRGLQQKAKPQSKVLSPPLAAGMEHIELKDVLKLLTPHFRELGPLHGPKSWTDIVETAYRRSTNLFISSKSWQTACELLSRNGAALCVLLTDRAVSRTDNPVQKPGHYFNALLVRARAGELHLDRSLLREI